MDIKKTTIAGFLLVLSAFLGAVGEEAIDADLWECPSKGLISDCTHGVKADGLRCYWNVDNKMKYEYCKEGWQKYEKKMTAMENPPVQVFANGRVHECQPDENRQVHSKTPCGEEGYLGEYV